MFTLLNDPCMLLVRDTEEYAEVILNCHRAVECRSCVHKFSCRHVKLVKQKLEDGIPELCRFEEQLKYDGTTSIDLLTIISSNPIKFMLGKADGHYAPSNPGEIVNLTPDQYGTCYCGSEWSDASLRKKSSLYSSTVVEEVHVYYRKCSDHTCNGIKEFDGNAEGVLNTSKFLINHEILRDYMRLYLICG